MRRQGATSHRKAIVSFTVKIRKAHAEAEERECMLTILAHAAWVAWDGLTRHSNASSTWQVLLQAYGNSWWHATSSQFV
jgi:hypothetical protein